MTEKLQIYKCEICGNIVQVLFEGKGSLICCGQNMKHMEPQIETTELGEKHAPLIEERSGKRYISVTRHPMTEQHYIQFIEGFTKDKKCIYLEFLNSNETAEIDVSNLEGEIDAIELCNIHGLWRNVNNV